MTDTEQQQQNPTPAETAPEQATPEAPTPAEAAPTEAAPTEAAPTEAAPTEAAPAEAGAEAPDPASEDGIRAQIVENIKMIYDPEIPVNIWELGLIYDIAVDDNKVVKVEMTLTSPMCPTAQSLVGQVEMAAREAPHVADATVELVWDPPWDMEKMSEEAKLMLGF